MAAAARPIQSVSNTELYNRWAKVYDTDGNILQAIDDKAIHSLLLSAFGLRNTHPTRNGLKVTELGCGTGRNTVKLLNPILAAKTSEINALDLSPEMLGLARKRCNEVASVISTVTSPPRVDFYEYDALNPLSAPLPSSMTEADLVISTLVLEHLPLDVFFKTVKGFLKTGTDGKAKRYLLLTNMHAEMGRKSQAGFLDEQTGEKIRGTSFVYDIPEVLEEGRKWGFEVEGQVLERDVKEDDVGEGKLLGPRGKKWVGCKVWFGCIMELKPDI